MLRLWNSIREQFIHKNKPKCYFCGNVACGDYYNEDWKSINLCKDCYKILEEKMNESAKELANIIREKFDK